MKIGMLFFSGKGYGLGHKNRCAQFWDSLGQNQHFGYMISNLQFRQIGGLYRQIRPDVDYDVWHLLHELQLDWLLIDLPPDLLHDYYFEIAKEFNTKIALLNAYGDPAEERADLAIIQGWNTYAQKVTRDKHYQGSKYVILRRGLEDVGASERQVQDFTFVFGGAEDKMNLLNKTSQVLADQNGIFVQTSLSTNIFKPASQNHHLYSNLPGEAIYSVMGMCNRAIVAMGISAWELAYLGIPTYIISPTKRHLGFALGMESKGLARAYPDVGIPGEDELRNFINEPFTLKKKFRPDTQAPERIIRLVESKTSE